jgi:tetratricopeptide (TPR) repeat protein
MPDSDPARSAASPKVLSLAARRCVLGSRQVRFMVKRACVNNELQLISRRLTGLCMKRPGLALGVWGEPGIGKTHTTLALLRGAPCQTWTVHSIQALEKIILQLSRPKKLTMWLEKTLERITQGETLEIGILNQALAALLAANAPVILHVEDLHEANLDRFEFWKQLALAVTRTRGVGLIVTSRVQPPEGFEAIRLSTLNREESDALLEAEASAKLPSEALAWLFERAAGNPLFTIEFFRLLARQGSLWNDGQRWRFRQPERETVPVTVEALIEQTLREAANTATLEVVVGAKAVLGLNIDENVWLKLTELKFEDFMKARETLQTRGILVKNEFAHPLYREVIVTGMPKDQRQILARRALEVLKDDPRVAAEFVKDANLEPEQTLALFQRAAQFSKTAGNEVQAAHFLALAVEYAQGEEKGKLAFEAAQELHHTDPLQATHLAQVAAELLVANTQALDLLSTLFAYQERSFEVEKTLERLPTTERSGTTWLLRLVKLRTIMRDQVGVLELWDAHPELHFQINPDLASDIAFALAATNRNDEARTIVSQALSKDGLAVNQRSKLLNVTAILHAFQGDFVGAEDFFAESVKLVRQAGVSRRIAGALTNHATALGRLGRYREMMTEHQEAMRLYGELGDGQGFARSQSLVGDQLIEFGEYEPAEETLRASLEQLEQGTLDDFVIQCEGSLSTLYLEWGLPQGVVLAFKYANAALRHARSLHSPSRLAEGLHYMTMVEVRGGNATKGLDLAGEELGIARRIEQPEAIYSAQHARGMALFALGNLQEALEALREAQQLAAEMRLPLEQHKVGLEIARLNNDIEQAKKHHEWFSLHGLMTSVNKACRYFPELKTNSHQSPTTPSAENMPHLEVLGSMQTTLEAQTTPMRGRKRQELLALLLEARVSGRGAVSKLELVEKLYPDVDEIQSNAGLRDVIYQIRSSLGENTLTTTMNGYALGSLKTDVETFLETGNTQLWRGIYLEGLTLETSDTVRESVYLALRTRAEALLETDPVEAIRVARILCEVDPYDLEAVRVTVTGLRAGQNHRSLARFYDQARTRFLEIGETLPETWQEFLSPVSSG